MTHAEGLSMADRYVLSVNTKPETRDRLDRLAAVTRRSKSFLANEAIERYLTKEEEFVGRVEARRAEMKDGVGITGDDLLSRFESRMERKFSTAKS